MRPLILSIIAFAAAACGGDPAPNPEAAGAHKETLRVAGPNSPHMREQIKHAASLRDAVLSGDLMATRAPAKWLVDNPPAGLATEAGELAAMQAAAQKAYAAKSLPEVAFAVGELSASCGQCHAKLDGGVQNPTPIIPPVGEGVDRHMARHRWAMVQMWQGVVLPSDAAWTRGARSFDEAALHPVDLTLVGAGPGSKALADQLHAAAKRAVATPSADRGAAFGQVLATCGECHRRREK